MRYSHWAPVPAILALASSLAPVLAEGPPPSPPGEYIVLSWNDLGMHCMTQWHERFSVLPPYNNLLAQVIHRGDPTHLPELITSGITLEYSIPGNTYSVGKTDFWTYDFALFGVDLPDNIGLTGNGLTGEFEFQGNRFVADGIPVTPFPDATPTIEDPFQQALVIARDASGTELAVSRPVIPVSAEVNCVSSGCHSSEQQILNIHPLEGGFDPTDTPILCARCHASPALGTTGDPEAFFFSFRIHDQHDFLDIQTPDINGCYKCHPGPNTRCLRDTMNESFGLECQDCHGNMHNMAYTIEQQDRSPWLEEPACRTCHTAQYGEPVGQLFRMSTGHGGIMCSGCHNSPHAILPSREARDNENVIALQGTAGPLKDCTVCHDSVPSGPGPHGITSSVEDEVLGATSNRIGVSPNPMLHASTFTIPAGSGGAGVLVAFDTQGRTVAAFSPRLASDGTLTATWDGTRRGGRTAEPGVYFLRWENGVRRAAGKLLIAK